MVRAEVAKRLPDEGERAIALLEATELPLLGNANRTRERARVHLAILKLSNGDVSKFEKVLRMAAVDWRDVLVAAGLANFDWPRVLEAAGYPVP